MGLLKDVLIGTAGYMVGNAVEHSTAVNTFIDRNFGNKSLEETIDDYAKTRLGVYTQDNRLAKMLHDIARRYEEYNYDDETGEEWTYEYVSASTGGNLIITPTNDGFTISAQNSIAFWEHEAQFVAIA